MFKAICLFPNGHGGIKRWQENDTRQWGTIEVILWIQLYGHQPPITKTIQVRRTRHAGHSWRSKDELISDVLLWTPTYGRAKAERPSRTYIQQLCEDTGCSPENLPEAMNDREKWRERSGISVLTAQHDDDDDDKQSLKLFNYVPKWSYCYCITILGTIWLCVNEWIVLNWIISAK